MVHSFNEIMRLSAAIANDMDGDGNKILDKFDRDPELYIRFCYKWLMTSESIMMNGDDAYVCMRLAANGILERCFRESGFSTPELWNKGVPKTIWDSVC